MISKIDDWHCEEKVSFKYFCCVGKYCSLDHIRKALTSIMADFPDHQIYIGITHKPCGRYTGNYNALPVPASLRLKVESVTNEGVLLQEKAHFYDYDQMFVICYTNNEDDIRKRERECIAFGWEMNEEQIDNTNPGGNGPLSVDAKNHYFLYACISKTKMIVD